MKSREEAERQGYALHEVKHNMKRRCRWHDYSDVGIYMLTLVVADRQPLLGRLVVNETVSEHSPTDAPRIELSNLGKRILMEEVLKINHFYPMVEVWKLCIMPDHIHMIVRVRKPMGKGKHLGNVVSGFKAGCSRAWWSLLDSTSPHGEPQGTIAPTSPAGSVPASSPAVKRPAAPVPAGSQMPQSQASSVPAGSPAVEKTAAPVPAGSPAVKRAVLFEKGYNDKLLLRRGQLNNWKHYLDDNPRRLAIKRQHPDYFLVLHNINIAGRNCQIVGNRFLLDIPDKQAVIVHRAYTDADFAEKRREWLAAAEAGAVLVSAAIAPREKEVMHEAMNRRYNVIWLRNEGFPALYKPTGRTFDYCVSGLILQISPWPSNTEKRAITREQCLQLNKLVEDIVNS